ncbi:MAG: ABC transporter ATP-binding protein [Chthoniobacteraceae bacterium]
MNAIIETHGLTRRFRGVEAVHELTFSVPEGKICAFLGPNGAGKTTTIKMLMNLIEPGAGTCSVMGIESHKLRAEHWQHIGYVSENQQLHEWMTVRQLLDYLRPFYREWDREFEQRLLADFALPAERKIKHLSRGMKMKLAMLTALAFRPRLLVLDEPFTGLDPLARDELVRGILEFTGRGDWTIFMSSHDVEEVERLADWIVMIDAGLLVLSESTADLQGRFRQITFVLDEPVPDHQPPWPAGWLGAEHSGRTVRATVVDFQESEAESIARRHFPALSNWTATSMSLREIFIALARVHRSTTTTP